MIRGVHVGKMLFHRGTVALEAFESHHVNINERIRECSQLPKFLVPVT